MWFSGSDGSWIICRLFATCVIALGVLAPQHAQAGVRVVASIEPLRGITEALLQPDDELSVVVGPGESPHGYQLTTAEAAALSRADVVLWVGPTLEGFLDKSISNLARDARVLTVLDLSDLTIYPFREGDLQGKAEQVSAGHGQEHQHHMHEHHGHHHHEGEADPHVWMDPDNAVVIARALVDVLKELHPAAAEDYERNFEAFEAELSVVDARIQLELKPVTQKAFVVYHDAFQYFEQHYGLRGQGAVVRFPEEPLSARRLDELGRLLKQNQVVCLFTEPQFASRVPEGVLEAVPALRVGVADPLGRGLSRGGRISPEDAEDEFLGTSDNGYILWLEMLAHNMLQCLSDGVSGGRD